MKTPINKFLYLGFLLLGLYQAIFNEDFIQAASSLGIGIIFDPFQMEQKWKDKPVWQKVVILLPFALVAALLGFGIGFKDK